MCYGLIYFLCSSAVSEEEYHHVRFINLALLRRTPLTHAFFLYRLIGSRALAGVGGGGIVSSVWVITAEIVEVRHRAKWSQALSITWSCSAVAGPLLGGLFSGAH